MADQENCTDINLLKRTKISVYVDEALPDILVVTFEFGVKVFKGVLLDSTKKNIPCGVPNLNPAFTAKPDEDTLYSVNQRYAYTDPANAKKKNVHISTKYKTNKMTVRLRPRQVLCTKCKGICNENSENVTRKRKISETMNHPPIKRSADAPITRSVHLEQNKLKKIETRRTLIPKKPQELPNALSGNVNKLNIQYNKINIDNNKKPLATSTNNTDLNLKLNIGSLRYSIEHSDSSNSDSKEADSKRVLRKKRGSSNDDYSNDSFLHEGANNNLNAQYKYDNNEQNSTIDHPLSSTYVNTRTIKICYGQQGEGTVLKIPAQIENLVDDSLEENINIDPENNESTNKAARKAMKKARKEAKRKVGICTNSSTDNTTSSSYSIGGSSPRYTVGSASPRHGLGNNSPRYVTMSGNIALDSTTPKKRKHKMKHKKKHREDKDRKHTNKEGECPLSVEEEPKGCIAQKLSINLKRLSTSSYTTIENILEKTEESSSDELSEQVPDFPPSNSPLVFRINAKTLSSATGADGRRLVIGDVVWGKIHGFPWWPGKVLTICEEPGGLQAHVAWYGSSTSSLIQCDQLSPYLDNFKLRYNKKKRGPYKEAIKQATTEARENAEFKCHESIITTPPKSEPAPLRAIISVVPPLASPREINVSS